MSFPAYDNYKVSGLEWLGALPGHWEIVQFKRLVLIQNGADYKHVERVDGYPVIGSGGPFTFASDYLYDGESVLLGRKGTIDKPLHVTGRFWTVDTMYWTKIRRGICGRYAFYTALTIPFDYYSTNTALPSMTQGALNAHVVALPPLPEQTAIATFLDRETARIDALVEAQERLIALLKEKRQAVISHAVTKGLDPSAPMKDSGVEWLGQVPAHWEVTSVKHAIEFATSGPRGWSDIIGGGDATFFQSQHIGRAMDIVLDGAARITPPDDTDAERARLTEDDVVVCITGARTGAVAHVRDLSAETYINQHVCLLRPLPARAKGRFLAYFLFSHGGQEQFALAMYGLKQGLGLDQVRAQSIALPPLDDQQLIADWLDRMLGQFSGLISSAEAAINLLQERRAALISAAVTGKIDVRGLAPAEEAAA